MTKVKSPKPIAVLISDVHYNQKTLELANASMRQAISKANSLNVPLIVAGDLHDTKANLRAECVNAMIETFKLAKEKPYVIIGNHDRINEKAASHALSFLSAYTTLITSPCTFPSSPRLLLLPYSNDPGQFQHWIRQYQEGSTIICHQGVEGSNMGDYIQDKSAIKPEDVAGRRVISGHYHARQTILLPDGGTWDYIGNPYTLGFGEANDPEKGYQILMEDGRLRHTPTRLPAHVVLEFNAKEDEFRHSSKLSSNDKLWVKVRGTANALSAFNKIEVANRLGITQPFRLDLIPDEVETTQIEHTPTQSGPEILDALIDSLTNTGDDQKERLKSLWKDLNEKT